MEKNSSTAKPQGKPEKSQKQVQKQAQQGPSIFGILKDYKFMVSGLVIFAIITNGLNLILPKIIASGIDAFTSKTLVINTVIFQLLGASLLILLFAYLQSVVQVIASEQVARDLRRKLSAKISGQSYLYVQQVTPAKLLTNLTSDIDAVKQFISQAVVSILSSLLLIIGASILLLLINWKLGFAVLVIIPLIGITFFSVFSRMRPLFKKSQEVIDWLNKVINESILGASLIRVLNSQQPEYEKFIAANTEAKSVGLSILRLFSAVIPTVTFIANIAIVTILALGGHFVIDGSMSLGDFTAFNSYVSILIFPIIIIGFTTNAIARAAASYTRVNEVAEAIAKQKTGSHTETLRGDIELKDVSIGSAEKPILKHISFDIKAGTRTAIIGPTAAGKTQLLYLLTGLTEPTGGIIKYDNRPISDYDQNALHKQIGFVFQDSIMFNLSLRENIAFSNEVTDQSLEKAIQTAELGDFIHTLPEKLDTIVSERGTSLSGGQKQRIMLARALALDPKILLLDDFTARVDTSTEKKILQNIATNYPGLTLVSVTQKIAAVEEYDEIIVLSEGEAIARGKHAELLESSPDYVQIFNSQRSTNAYELQA